MDTPSGMTYSRGFLRPLDQLGSVSALGIGSCLGDPDDDADHQYEKSVVAALACGINLVDTAINYRRQRSERAVGRALRRAGGTRVVVCTKGGYIPLDTPAPATRADYRAYIRSEYMDPGIVSSADLVAGGHCIAPAFLHDQIARSLRNIAVPSIDVYCLHNPEQQLDAVTPEEFDRRLHAAFAALEESVWSGSIRAYGCATWNGLRVFPDAPNHLSLESLVRAARDVAGDRHNFKAIQVPVSLAMSEAVRVPTQLVRGKLRTVLEAASELGVSVMATAPLMQGRLAESLPDAIRSALPEAGTDAARALGFVRDIPGITSVIVGMRSPEHVRENRALFV